MRVLRRKVDSQLRFAAQFDGDERTPAVLNDAAASLLSLSEYQLAIIAAATLTNRRRAAANPVAARQPGGRRTAGLSWKPMSTRPPGYRDVLARMPASDDRRESTVERLAASLYRRAEVIAAGGDAPGAANAVCPGGGGNPQCQLPPPGPVRCGAVLHGCGEYQRANRLLMDFRDRFKDDSLAAEVPLKLVYNYEQLEQWERRGANWTRCSRRRRIRSARAEMLYLTAEHYDKRGQSRAVDRPLSAATPTSGSSPWGRGWRPCAASPKST